MRKTETFANRLNWIREKHALTLREFASLVRATSSYISKLERGISTNPSSMLIQQICQSFNVSEIWLLKGLGDPFLLPSLNEMAKAAAPITTLNLKLPTGMGEVGKVVMTPALLKSILGMRSYDDPLRDLLAILKQPPYGPALTLETAKTLAYVVESFQAKTNPALGIDDVSELGKSACEVNPILPKLLDRLAKQTIASGSKSALAEWLGVPLSNLSLWLSGKREPGGETTLKMLYWVERKERKTK